MQHKLVFKHKNFWGTGSIKHLLGAALCWVLVWCLPPIQTHAQAGYHIIYMNDAGEIVALNPVSGEQHIILNSGNPLENAIGLHVAPSGDYLAVFVRGAARFHLYVATVPDGQIVLDHDLLPPGYDTSSQTPGDPAYELTRALGEMHWSPTSRHLAFISAQNGTADLFIFEPATRSIIYQENGAQTAALAAWNPSGTALVFSELISFGDGVGYQMAGFYALTLPAADLRSLVLPPASAQGVVVVGWLDAHRLVIAPLDFSLFGARGLYLLDLNTGNHSELLPPHISMTVPVFDPTTRTLAFTVPEAGTGGLVPGAYIWQESDPLPTLLQSGAFYTVEALHSGVFQFETATTSYLFHVADYTAEEPPALLPLPPHDFGAFVAPSGGAVALLRADGVYISRVDVDDATLVWSEEAQVPLWSPDGAAFYSFGFTGEGAGLVEINVNTRSLRLLDTRMAIQSPRALAPG